MSLGFLIICIPRMMRYFLIIIKMWIQLKQCLCFKQDIWQPYLYSMKVTQSTGNIVTGTGLSCISHFHISCACATFRRVHLLQFTTYMIIILLFTNKILYKPLRTTFVSIKFYCNSGWHADFQQIQHPIKVTRFVVIVYHKDNLHTIILETESIGKYF